MKTLIFLITIIATTSLMRSGEIIPVWQTVWDIEATSSYQRTLGQKFLKGHDQFLTILVDSDIGSIQVRETLSGETVDSIKIYNVYEENKFEILPDSNRFIMSVGGVRNIPAGFEIRNINDFSIVNKFQVPLDGESTNENGNHYNNRIIEIKIDPVRPYVYFILEKGINGKQSDTDEDYYAIKVYNYQTGKEIKELRTYKDDYMKFIDISHDGRYLASLNEGESFLYVWEINSFNQIEKYELDKSNSDNSWRENVRDLKFSKLDSDIVYFSGSFSKIGSPEEFESGLFKYSIEESNHINELPEVKYTGKLIFAENEKLLFINNDFTLVFINFNSKKLEFSTPQPDNHRIVSNAIYTSKHKCFISSNNAWFYSTQYLTTTSLYDSEKVNKVIYPNPTTNNVQIETSCKLSQVQLELMDVNGSLLLSQIIQVMDGYISFDLSNFPSGSYFIRLICGEEVNSYKVVKEG